MVELGSVCEIKNGYAFKSSEFKKSGTPLIRISSFDNGAVYFDDKTVYVDSSYLRTKSGFKVEKGDVLIALSGATTGKYGIYTGDEPSLLNQRIGLLKSGASEQMNDKFFYYYLSVLKSEILRNAGGAAQPNISTKSISEFKIPLPTLDQQKKIATILDAADTCRQKTKALIKKYDELTQSLFLDMFGDPVRNPKGWEKVVFGNFITVLTDYHSNGSYETLSKHVTLKNELDFSLMVRTTDLEKNNFIDGVKYIDEHAYNYLTKSKIYGGEIIMNKIGSAGKVYRMPKLNRPVSLGMNAFLLRFNDSINQVFLYFQLTSNYGEREIQKRVKGAVTKTIRKDAVREIPILSPPLELQNQFAERVEVIEAQKAQAKASLAQAEDLFNSLLQRAFKGELS